MRAKLHGAFPRGNIVDDIFMDSHINFMLYRITGHISSLYCLRENIGGGTSGEDGQEAMDTKRRRRRSDINEPVSASK